MNIKPKISIVIPVYKDLQGLKKTIGSIEKQDLTNVEIIVINDGADPETDRFCMGKGLVTKTLSQNLGSYNARNEGIKLAQSDYLAFTDADLVVGKKWLKAGLSYLQRYDYVAGNVQINRASVHDVATFHDYLTAFPVEKYFNGHHFGVTANLFVNKKVFDKVGLFDFELRSGGDLEFGDRVFRAGIPQVYVSECMVEHPPRGHQEKVKKLKRVRQGQKQLLEKYPDRFGFLKYKSNLKNTVREMLPPSVNAVNKIYSQESIFPFWKFYGYVYWWSIVNLRYRYW